LTTVAVGFGTTVVPVDVGFGTSAAAGESTTVVGGGTTAAEAAG
jgi:hypothetical protein